MTTNDTTPYVTRPTVPEIRLGDDVAISAYTTNDTDTVVGREAISIACYGTANDWTTAGYLLLTPTAALELHTKLTDALTAAGYDAAVV